MAVKEILNLLKQILNETIFTLNQTAITPLSILTFIIIVIAFIFISKFIKTRVLAKILDKFHIDKGLQYTLLRLTHYLIVFVGLLIGLQFIGINLSGLAVILGFLSVGIGFGLQNVTSNFVAGLILLFERPIKVGDRITVDGTEGDVEQINIRSTSIRTLLNTTIIVPNEKFVSSSVLNWSHGDLKTKIIIEVGVSYSSDLDTVIKALHEVANESEEILKEPKTEVHLRKFGDSSWNMQLRVWIDNPKKLYDIQSDLNCAIVKKFKDYDIEIPFPQRDLHVRSVVPLETKN